VLSFSVRLDPIYTDKGRVGRSALKDPLRSTSPLQCEVCTMLRAQDLRAKVLRSTLPPPRRCQLRPDFETLERRQLLSPVDWISSTSGSWDVASNC
jgi:hypothetical protein